MRTFRLRLGRSVVLETDEETVSALDLDEKRYRPLAFGELTADGRIRMIAFQPCHTEQLAKSLKDDELFSEEVKIEVWKYNDEQLRTVDGILLDALLIAANDGGEYDV